MVEQVVLATETHQSATELYNKEHSELVSILKDGIVPRIKRMQQLFVEMCAEQI